MHRLYPRPIMPECLGVKARHDHVLGGKKNSQVNPNCSSLGTTGIMITKKVPSFMHPKRNQGRLPRGDDQSVF